MKTFKNVLLFFSTCFLLSCGGSSGDDETKDTTQPSITINSPTTDTSVAAGENLNVDIVVSDDTSLSAYTIEISFSSSLETSAIKSTKIVPEEFEYESDSDSNVPAISGTSTNINYDIEIATNAASGNYRFFITVTDSAGNSSSSEVIFQIT